MTLIIKMQFLERELLAGGKRISVLKRTTFTMVEYEKLTANKNIWACHAPLMCKLVKWEL